MTTYTTPKVAEMLSLTPNRIYRAVILGLIPAPAIRANRQRYTPEEVVQIAAYFGVPVPDEIKEQEVESE